MPYLKRFSDGGYVQWYGRDLGDAIEAEVIAEIHETTKKAADYARAHHPWQNQSGDLEAGIFADEPIVEGDVVRGRWGAPPPALYLEFGTVRSRPFPFLRPAADYAYGGLGVRMAMRVRSIRARIRGTAAPPMTLNVDTPSGSSPTDPSEVVVTMTPASLPNLSTTQTGGDWGNFHA